MRVTAESLRALGACEYQVVIFAGEWPDGVEVSLEALMRAAELGLGFKWLGHRVLSGAARKKFEEDIAQAWAKYTKDTAPAWKTYEEEAAAPAWKAYQKATASALWEALQS